MDNKMPQIFDFDSTVIFTIFAVIFFLIHTQNVPPGWHQHMCVDIDSGTSII